MYTGETADKWGQTKLRQSRVCQSVWEAGLRRQPAASRQHCSVAAVWRRESETSVARRVESPARSHWHGADSG
jgi:hypothetical protein